MPPPSNANHPASRRYRYFFRQSEAIGVNIGGKGPFREPRPTLYETPPDSPPQTLGEYILPIDIVNGLRIPQPGIHRPRTQND